MTQAAATVCEKQRAIFRHAELELLFSFSTNVLTIYSGVLSISMRSAMQPKAMACVGR
jgi:hypothetical protein